MTQKEKIIKNAEVFVKGRLAAEATGHDWWHIQRVRNNARLLCISERADRFLVDIAVLLHDVGDRKVIKQAEDDYSIAKDFLKTQNMPTEDIDTVLFIIQNMSFSKSLNAKKKSASTEFYVVQDADRLDALGAIGIARVFAYGGSRSRPLYDPTKRAQSIHTTAQYRKEQSSSFHHFEEKILLLKDLMNTKTGKQIAIGRHKYVKAYIKEFLAEWEGTR